MKTVVIVAHPHTTADSSHTRHGFEYAISRLEGADANFEVIDLYDEKFDPVMRRKPTRHHEEQIARYRSLIDEADSILIHYPVWWNGPPAILKGFFDCLLTPGWGYHYVHTPIPKVGIPVGHLKGKRAAIITTSGSLNVIHQLVQHARAGRVISHDTLRFAGMRTRRYNVGGCQVYDAKNCRIIEHRVDRALRWLRAL